ncbi:MAG: glycosyltransferase family 2 protein [Bacteroidota bacterium]|nr:glycosyltransferase family 2 protein [Bacteroidota bacterium]
MKVTGFSFIKNAVKYDFPIVEAITSILPICDEFVIAVGKSEDDTLGLINSIGSPKIRIVETVWDETLREGGRVLADETNKAYNAISADTDWCFYIQGDEVFHENDLPKIKAAMELYNDDKTVEGLVFDHINFFGSYDFIADSRHWQKKEVRVVRKGPSINSHKDAMSFRKNGEKLYCKLVDATIYHYGWVKDPRIQTEKRKAFEKLWHDDNWMEENIKDESLFDYSSIDSVKRFTGTHPAVIAERIKKTNWTFEFDPTRSITLPLKKQLLNWFYQTTGIHIGEFKNYRVR